MKEKSPPEIIAARLLYNANKRAARQEFHSIIAKWHAWYGSGKPQG